MTELTITPKVSDKTARFKGTIAAGEHVAVTIKGGAGWIDNGASPKLRVIDLTTKRTLAVFPYWTTENSEDRPDDVTSASADAWETSGDDNADLSCTLNLNTTRMVNAARHMLRVPVLFVLGDSDASVRTLYFCDRYEVMYWPERIGDDTPYDLDRWPKKIDDWTELVAEWTARLDAMKLEAVRTEAVGTTPGKTTITLNDGTVDTDTVVEIKDGEVSGEQFSAHTDDTDIHVTAAKQATWGAKQDALTFDNAPTANSANPVKSGGVKTAIDTVATNLSTHTNNADIHVTASQKTAWTAKYDKPSGGIPKTDLADGVKASLALADSAIQAHQDISGKADKSDTYTKSQVDSIVAAVKSGSRQIVASLDSVTNPQPLVIYMVAKSTAQTNNAYDEYIYVTVNNVGKWEKIGDTEIDLSGYAETADLATVATSGSYNDLSNKPTIPAAVTVDSALSGTSENPVQNKVVKAAVDAKCSLNEAVTEVTRVAAAVHAGWEYTSLVPNSVVADINSEVGEGWDTSKVYLLMDQPPQVDQNPDLTWSISFRYAKYVYITATEDEGWRIQEEGYPANYGSVSDEDYASGTYSFTVENLVVCSYGRLITPEENAHGLARLADLPTKTSDLTNDSGFLTSHQSLDGLMPKYDFATATVTSGTLTVSPYTVATFTANSTAATFSVAVGNGTSGKARDCILVIDCTATGAVAPTVTWPSNFHPRTDTATDLAIVEAGKRAVFYISEYASGEFAVGGWTETEGGNA